MIFVVAAAMAAQFAVGEEVCAKADRTPAYASLKLAKARYRESASTLSSASDAFDANLGAGTGKAFVAFHQKNQRYKILHIEKSEGDTICRVETRYDDVVWINADDLKKYDGSVDEQEAMRARAEAHAAHAAALRKKIDPFIRNRNEAAVAERLISQGIDPIKATTNQTKDFTASQRRALSRIRANYQAYSK